MMYFLRQIEFSGNIIFCLAQFPEKSWENWKEIKICKQIKRKSFKNKLKSVFQICCDKIHSFLHVNEVFAYIYPTATYRVIENRANIILKLCFKSLILSISATQSVYFPTSILMNNLTVDYFKKNNLWSSRLEDWSIRWDKCLDCSLSYCCTAWTRRTVAHTRTRRRLLLTSKEKKESKRGSLLLLFQLLFSCLRSRNSTLGDQISRIESLEKQRSRKSSHTLPTNGHVPLNGHSSFGRRRRTSRTIGE